MATAATTIDENLDTTPAVLIDESSLHERFPEGELLNLKEFTDFSNVGKRRPLYNEDGKRKLDADDKPMFEDVYRYGVYDTDGKTVIGYFTHTASDISWSYIRVKTNHFTNDQGVQYLYFEVLNKLNSINDVVSFVKGKDLLKELTETF